MRLGWIIRGLFVLLLLMSIGGWVRSFTYFDYRSYFFHGKWIGFTSEDATFIVGVGWGSSMSDGVSGSSFSQGFRLWPTNETAFYGFRMGFFGPGSDAQYYVAMPYWFLIILFALLLTFVWWRTRRRKVVIGAFPVEVGNAHS